MPHRWVVLLITLLVGVFTDSGAIVSRKHQISKKFPLNQPPDG